MTQNSSNQRPKIALFEPDIPQNTAAIIRTCACLGAKLEIIEPCGFLFSDKRFKRVVMDYMDEKDIKFYQSADIFFQENHKNRIILMTTKASISYTKFKFDKTPLDKTTKLRNLNLYSKSYLNHLIKTNEILASMIISLHNVNFYQQFMHQIRKEIKNRSFNKFYNKYINKF